MKGRRDDEFIFRKVLGGPRKIYRDIAMMQSIIKKLDVFAQAEVFIGLHGLLQRPIIIMAVEDADVRDNFRALDGGSEEFEFIAKLADFLVGAAVLAAIVREDRAI